MSKKPVFSFSVVLMLFLVFALALVGCEGDVTDKSGVVPQSVGPDGFTNDPADSCI